MEPQNSIKLDLDSSDDDANSSRTSQYDSELTFVKSALSLSRDENIKLHSNVSEMVAEIKSLKQDLMTAREELSTATVSSEVDNSQEIIELQKEFGVIKEKLNKANEENVKLHTECDIKGGELRTIHNELRKLRSELEIAEKENAKMPAKVGAISIERDEIQKELDVVREKLRLANDENVSLHSDSDHKEKDLKSRQEQIDTLTEQLNLVKSENENLQSQGEVKEGEVKLLQEQLDVINGKLDLVEKEKAELHKDEDSKLSEITSMKDELHFVREKLNIANEELEKHQSEKGEKDVALQTLKSELHVAQEKINLSNKENENLQQQGVIMKDEVKLLQSELKSVRAELNQAMADNTSLHDKDGVKDEEVDLLKAKLNEASKEAISSKKENSEILLQSKSKEEEIKSLEGELKIMSDKLELAEKEKTDRLSVEENVGEQVALLQAELSEVRNEVSSSKDENEELLTQSKSKEEKVQSLQGQLEGMRKKLESAIAQNKDLISQRADQESKLLASDGARVKLDFESDHESVTEATQDEVAPKDSTASVRLVVKDSSPVKLGTLTSESSDLHNSIPIGRHKKLRKFQGCRNQEEKKEKVEESKSLLGLVKEYKSRMASGESIEEIALSIAKLDPEKLNNDEDSQTLAESKKAYSPDRTFEDLLEDNERRKVINTPESVEKAWLESTQVNEAEGDVEERAQHTSYRPVAILAALACLGLVGAMVYLLNNRQEEPKSIVQVSEAEKTTTNLAQAQAEAEEVEVEEGGINLQDDTVREAIRVFTQRVLEDFHQSEDLKYKASLCRVPVRTLIAMKPYYAKFEDGYSVKNVIISPNLVELGDLKLVKAEVVTVRGDDESRRLAFFELEEDDELKLDWFNYIDSEGAEWEDYVVSEDTTPRDWKVEIDFEGDEHPDYPAEEYAALRVRSFSKNAYTKVYANLKKDEPRYQDLLEAYQKGHKVFIMKIRKIADDSGYFIVDEIVSLDSFYHTDITAVPE